LLVRSWLGQNRRVENRDSEELEGGPIHIPLARREWRSTLDLAHRPLVEL
jgi:hypothetical protein